jgi:hypothetical protein
MIILIGGRVKAFDGGERVGHFEVESVDFAGDTFDSDVEITLSLRVVDDRCA